MPGDDFAYTGEELAEFYAGYDDPDEAREVLFEVWDRHCSHDRFEEGFHFCPTCGRPAADVQAELNSHLNDPIVQAEMRMGA